jgi:hypothetical protein
MDLAGHHFIHSNLHNINKRFPSYSFEYKIKAATITASICVLILTYDQIFNGFYITGSAAPTTMLKITTVFRAAIIPNRNNS